MFSAMKKRDLKLMLIWSFLINGWNKIIKLKFAFKKKQTLAVSGHIIFQFKMNLIFIETFLEKSIYLKKEKNKFFTNLLWQRLATIENKVSPKSASNYLINSEKH